MPEDQHVLSKGQTRSQQLIFFTNHDIHTSPSLLLPLPPLQKLSGYQAPSTTRLPQIPFSCRAGKRARIACCYPSMLTTPNLHTSTPNLTPRAALRMITCAQCGRTGMQHSHAVGVSHGRHS
jgi:hypothetical protein